MNPLFWYTSNAKEILEFVHNRQVYVKPLNENRFEHVELKNDNDIVNIASKHNGLVGFYASPTIYVEGKVVAATPVWVIELLDNDVWRLGLDAAWLITRFLDRHGVRESLYLVYHSRFFEVRLHEASLKGVEDPVESAYKIVELVLRELKVKLQRLVFVSGAKIRIYNGLDGYKLIAPKSLYDTSRASSYFKPNDIELFDPSWTNIEEYRYNPEWKRYVEGEAAELAAKAQDKVKDNRKTIIMLKKVAGPRKIDRFPVMGLLQAARYYILTGDLEKAKSFGYNRAVFYAWAKHYGRGFRTLRRLEEKPRLSSIEASKEGVWRQEEVFGEPVMVSPRGWYGMGGEEHTPRHFDEHIARKIELQVPFEVAWKAALEYVKKFPREVLTDQQEFFKKVYQPVRDSFIEDVLLKRTPPYSQLNITITNRGEALEKNKVKETRKSTSKPPVVTLDSFLKKQEEINKQRQESKRSGQH